MAACDSASQDKGLDVPEAAWRLPESAGARRVCLRELLRVIPPDEVCAEVQAWLGECGSAAHGLRLALSDSDIRALRNSPSGPPLPQREVILGHLRERNKSAANIGFDLLVQPLEGRAERHKRDEDLSTGAWLQLVRAELAPALHSATLARISRERRGRVWQLCARVSRVAALELPVGTDPDNYYAQLVKAAEAAPASEANDDIARDLARTMPDVVRLAPSPVLRRHQRIHAPRSLCLLAFNGLHM